MKKTSAIIGLIAIAIFMTLAGCSQLVDGPENRSEQTGSITLNVETAEARTVQPSSATIAVTKYSITGTGPFGAVLAATEQTTATFTLSKLAVGAWTFAIDGKNAAGDVIAKGSATATIVAGTPAAAAVLLAPLSGTGVVGTFTMAITWPSTVTVSSVAGTITPETGTAQPFTAIISGSTASYSIATLPVGSYTLNFTVSTSSGSVYKAIHALRIYKDLTSPLNLTIAAADFIAMPKLSITPPSVTSGTTGTVYSFTLAAANIPSGVSSVTFAWNFGDGSATATGTATATVVNGQASKDVTHTYTANSSYGLVTTVSNGTTTLASANASVIIGTATVRPDVGLTALDTWKAATAGGYGLTVDTWDISTLPVGAKFDIQFDMMTQPDKCIIEYPAGTIVYDSGWRGGSSYEGNPAYPGGIAGIGQGTKNDLFVKGTVDSFKVTIIGGETGTAWNYSMRAHL